MFRISLFPKNTLNKLNKISLFGSIRSRKEEIEVQKLVRLERILSNRGAGSRSAVAKLINKGCVLVNDQLAKIRSAKYPEHSDIKINGEPLHPIPVLALYHKPFGIHSTMDDNWGRKCLALLKLDYPFLSNMHPVGRLDADTTGLLLFSKEGDLTHVLLHPSSSIPREYTAKVKGEVDKEKLSKVLENGVQTTDGTFSAELLEAYCLPVKQDQQSELKDSSSPLSTVLSQDEAYADLNTNEHQAQPHQSIVKLRVCEGKYRMVRRMLHNSGHSVLELHREKYGKIVLGDLEVGGVRPCTKEEAEWALGLLSKN